jgi:2-dehydropantoate 2-reductase
LHLNNKIIDEKTIRTGKTAHKITVTLKTHLRAIKKTDVSIQPSSYKIILKCPNIISGFFFMIWLRTKMVKDMLAPDFANGANKEIMQLNRDLLKFFSQYNINL